MSLTVRFEITVQEGYSDRRGARRETLGRQAGMECVPRVGDTVETGWDNGRVSWVDWSPWDNSVFIRLDETFSLAEPVDDVIAALRKDGWS